MQRINPTKNQLRMSHYYRAIIDYFSIIEDGLQNVSKPF